MSYAKITIPQNNRPQNFDFLAVFSTLRWIANKTIPISEIVAVLQSSINDDQFRDVIQRGIVSYYTRHNSTKIVESIYNQLTIPTTCNNDKKESSADDDNNNINVESISSSACDKALSVQSIVCKVFSYMNVKSLCNCSKVNIQWLYDSYQPCSIYHINIDTILNRKRTRRPYVLGFSTVASSTPFDVDLTRFRHVESIRIDETLNRLIEPINRLDSGQESVYSNYVRSLTRVKKLSIPNFLISVYPRPSVIDSTLQFLFQNMNHLESIEIVRGNKSGTRFLQETPQVLAQLSRSHHVCKFNHFSLTASTNTGIRRNTTLWGYICDNIGKFGKLRRILAYCGDSYDEESKVVTFPQIKNEAGLKILKLTGIKYVELSFWQSLISNKNNLSNIEEFTLEIPHVATEMKDCFENQIIPTVCARIIQKNLNTIELHLPPSLISYPDDNTSDRFSASTFFVDNFVDNMVLSMQKLHYFEQQFIKLKCCVKMGSEVMNIKLEAVQTRKDKRDVLGQLESISWDYEGKSFEKNCNHYRNLSIDIVKSVKELELKLHKPLCVVDHLLDFLCIDDRLKRDRHNNTNTNKHKKENKTQNNMYTFNWNPTRMSAQATTTLTQVQKNDMNNVNTTIDDICAVCINNDSIENNLILFCDRCDKALHQICANVDSIPQGDWCCRECQSRLDGDNQEQEHVVPHGSGDGIFNGTFTFGKDENSDIVNQWTSQQVFSFGKNNNNNNSNSNNNNNGSKNSSNHNLDWSSFGIVNDSSDNTFIKDKKRISRIEKLTIDGNDKISTEFLFRVLNNYVRFDNNCLKNIQLNGLKLSKNILDGFNQIEMAVEQSVQFFKENVNASFDITLNKKADVLKEAMYASKLIGMFRKVLNDLPNNVNVNNGNESVRIRHLRICISTQLIQTLALGDDLIFETDWIKTIVNGFKSMSIDDSVPKSCDLSNATWQGRRKVFRLPNGIVTMNLLKSDMNMWGQKTSQMKYNLRIDFVLLFCNESHA